MHMKGVQKTLKADLYSDKESFIDQRNAEKVLFCFSKIT